MLHPSYTKRVKLPYQKCAQVEPLAKPEQALRDVEMLQNKSGELWLAPVGVGWTSSLPHLQLGTAPFLPLLYPERQSNASSAKTLRASFQTCSMTARKDKKGRRGSLMDVELVGRVGGYRSSAIHLKDKGAHPWGSAWGCSIQQLLLPGDKCWQQEERSGGSWKSDLARRRQEVWQRKLKTKRGKKARRTQFLGGQKQGKKVAVLEASWSL